MVKEKIGNMLKNEKLARVLIENMIKWILACNFYMPIMKGAQESDSLICPKPIGSRKRERDQEQVPKIDNRP